MKVLPPGGNAPDEPGFYWVLVKGFGLGNPDRWEPCEIDDNDPDMVNLIGTDVYMKKTDDEFLKWGPKLEAPCS